MQQQKNVILFVVLSFLLLVGMTTFQAWMWPPPKPKMRFLLPDPHVWVNVPTQPAIVQGPGVPGLGQALELAAQAAVAQWAAGERNQWVQLPVETKPAPKPAPPPVVVAPPQPAREIRLGNESFNIVATLTARGAGVQALTLTRFQEATALGLPAAPPEQLRLIPADSHFPSYLLYSYADPKDTNPVDTLGKLNWRVAHVKNGPNAEVHEVAFEADVPGQNVTITKTFTLAKGDYHLGLAVSLKTKPGDKASIPFRYQMTGGHGLPIEGDWYTYTYRNALIGLVDDTRDVVYRDLQDPRTISVQDGGQEVMRGGKQYIGYAGVANQYFASMIVVDDQQPERGPKNFLDWARPTLEGKFDLKRPELDDITARVISQPIELQPGKPVVHKYLLYNGPVKVLLLGELTGDKEVAPELVHRYLTTLHLNTLTDYQSPNVFGSFASKIGWTSVLIWCTNFMHGLLNWLHYLVPNYGICIILLTVLVRGCMFPLSRKQALASARMQEKIKDLAPEVKKLEEKHRTDPLALQQAKNELYMRKGINPLTMMGSCWMVFLQMPIFMGLYYALQESIFFRLEPFLWMPNLAAPDMLFKWGNIPIVAGFLGPFFNLLPVIAAGLMIVQQRMTMPPPTNEQEEMQQKMMKYMSVFLGIMFYKMAAGLCVYFIASSLWGLAERKLLPKKTSAGPGPVPPAAAPVRRGPTGPRSGRPPDRNGEADGDGVLHKLKEWWAEVLKQASKK